MRRWKRLCALLTALCLLWTCVPLSALAAETTADTAYALLYDDGTLVFQRTDKPDASRGSVTNTYKMDLREEYRYSSFSGSSTVPWYSKRESIVAIDFADTLAPASTAEWFADFSNLVTVSNLNLLDTSKVTSMYRMFDKCYHLVSMDVSGFDTSNVTNMARLFNDCFNLTKLDVSGFDTSHVTDMGFMFSDCSSLTELDVSAFDTSDVTDMRYMFYQCRRLTELDVSGFDTSHITNMGSIFQGCSGLTELDVSGFDTSNVTNMDSVFYDCSSLTELDLSGFDTSNVTDMDFMFNGCSNLTAIYVSDKFVTDKVSVALSMFSSCKSLHGGNGTAYDYHFDDEYARIDSPQAPGYFTHVSAKPAVSASAKPTATETANHATASLPPLPENGVYAFLYDDRTLVFQFSGEPDASHGQALKTYAVDLEGLLGMGYTFESDVPWYSNRQFIKTVDFADSIAPVSMQHWFEGLSNLTQIRNLNRLDTSKVKKMDYLFDGCSSLTELDLSGFDTSNVTSMYRMFNECSALKKLNVSSFNTSNVTWMPRMFDGCSSLRELDVSGFDTSHVTDMGLMFNKCSSLLELDVSGFDTSNVTDMPFMFNECSSLLELDVSGFDTSHVTDMSYLFNGCSNFTELDVSGFDTSSVTDMGAMFSECSQLFSLDVSGFDASHVTDTSFMFSECFGLTELNLGSFDTSNVTDMHGMFSDCESLRAIYASDKFVTDDETASSDMFKNCQSLRGGNGAEYDENKIDAEYARIDSANAPGYFTHVNAKPPASEATAPDYVYVFVYDDETMVFQRGATPDASHGAVTGRYQVNLNRGYAEKRIPWSGNAKVVDFADTISPVSTAYWFSHFWNLTEIRHLERLDTSKVTDMSGMFSNCESLTALDLSGFDTSNVTSMSEMFAGCMSLAELDVSGFNTSNVTNMSGMFNMMNMFDERSELTELNLSSFDTSNVTDMSYMFYDCSALTTIYAGRFDTSSVTDMACMFSGCESLTALDLSGFDTSKVTSMFHMFDNCNSLTELNVSGFDTSNVTDMYAMFRNCNGLSTLDVSGFDTSNVTDMGNMFSHCFNLTKLDVSGLNTSKVTSMYYMFYDCENLTALDLSGFDTSNVKDMESMFDRCESLTALDVSHFDTSNVMDMSWMFAFCSSLTELDLSGFDTSNVEDMFSMFRNCENLKTLDLSGFDTSKVAYMSWMFAGDANLTTIYASDRFVTEALEAERFTPGGGTVKEESASMFRGDTSLVGGNGTNYDAHFDKGTEYARIDSADAPGYFTRAGAAPAVPNPVPRYVAQILVNDKPLSFTNSDSSNYLTSGNFFTHTQGKQGAYTLRALDQYGEEFTDLNWTMDSPNPNVKISGSTVTVNPQAPINETCALHASGSEVSAKVALFVIPDMTGKVEITPETLLINENDEAFQATERMNTKVEMEDLLSVASDVAGVDAAKLIAEGKLTADNLRVTVTKVMDLDFGESMEDSESLTVYPVYKIMTASGEEAQAEKRLWSFGQRKVIVSLEVSTWLEPVWALHTRPDGATECLPVKPAEGLENVYTWEQNGYGPVIVQGHIGLRGLLISGGLEEERDGPSYAITVLRTSGGSVFANVSKARSAAEIILTVMENNGYRLGALQVQMTGGAAVSVSGSGLMRTFIMPTGNVTITATFILTDGNPSANPAPEIRVAPTAAPSWINVTPTNPAPTATTKTVKASPFSDVPVSHSLFNEIVWADNRGIMKGYSNGEFQPGKAVSSITAVVVLARLDNSSLKNASTGLWYKPYETWANGKGLLKSDTRNVESIVMQDAVFSRGSMALLMTRYLKSKGRDVTPAKRVTLQDANQMRPGEEAAFQYLYGIGIFQGASSQRIQMNPRGYLTRAQLAALLYRLNGVL